MTRALHHVALGARDVERVARFYRELLGLGEVKRRLGDDGQLFSIWLEADGLLVMIERTSDPAREVTGVGAGPFLLAFRVTVAERSGIEHALEASGVAIESRTAHSSYFRDPEGNRVAISHHPDA